jgi:hypothetical protein
MIKVWTFAIVATVIALTPIGASAQLTLVGASQKVCQLNGDTDWQTGLPTAAQTLTNFGMQAADLGTPVDSGGATLYFLFGDTWPIDHPAGSVSEVPPDDSVGTSTLTTTPTSTACLGLQLATSAPKTLARPTVTPPIDQGSFNVPTGGVYANTSLYVFFWANHCMRQSFFFFLGGASGSDGDGSSAASACSANLRERVTSPSTSRRLAAAL